MEDAGTSEEDDIDSQDSNTPIDHGHLAWKCLINKYRKFILATLKHHLYQKFSNFKIAPLTPGFTNLRNRLNASLKHINFLLKQRFKLKGGDESRSSYGEIGRKAIEMIWTYNSNE